VRSAREEKRVQCTRVASGRSEPGRLDIHPPRPRISLQRTARDGRCGVNRGRISTCDLTRARYLPPLSLRGRRERFRSFTAEKRSFSLLFHLLLRFFPFLSFRRNLTAVLNIRLDYLRSSPTRSAQKGCAYTKVRKLFAGELKFHRLTDNSDESDKREKRAMLMISIKIGRFGTTSDIWFSGFSQEHGYDA